jgi:hypothetical protein
MSERCPHCNALLKVVGWSHPKHCRFAPVAGVPKPAPAEQPPARVTKVRSVTKSNIVTAPNSVTPRRRGRPPIGELAMSGVERTRRWRAGRRTPSIERTASP